MKIDLIDNKKFRCSLCSKYISKKDNIHICINCNSAIQNNLVDYLKLTQRLPRACWDKCFDAAFGGVFSGVTAEDIDVLLEKGYENAN